MVKLVRTMLFMNFIAQTSRSSQIDQLINIDRSPNVSEYVPVSHSLVGGQISTKAKSGGVSAWRSRTRMLPLRPHCSYPDAYRFYWFSRLEQLVAVSGRLSRDRMEIHHCTAQIQRLYVPRWLHGEPYTCERLSDQPLKQLEPIDIDSHIEFCIIELSWSLVRNYI